MLFSRVLFRILLALIAGILFSGSPTAVAAGIGDSQVIRVYDVPRADYRQLRKLGNFWGINWREDHVYLYVTPRGREAVEALGYRVETDIRKTQSMREFAAIDRQAWRDAGRAGIPGFECYRTVGETHADLAALADDYPNLARWETIGQSWLAEQGNPAGDDIHVLIIGNQQVTHDQAPLVVMAAQHARELTTAESAARFAEWLVTGYDDDPTARWLVDHREIHIIAQQNPDGRREVEQGESFWRKNSNLDACPGGTPGVDLNRNSNYFWGEASSGDACSQTYRGFGPASEPETQAVQDYMDEVFERHWPATAGAGYRRGSAVPADAEGIFLSLHSFSELILFPWEGSGSGTENQAPNHNQLAWLGRKLGFFTGYQVGRDILYSAGGTMTDFAHGEFGVASYTYEIGTDFQQSCASFENSIWPDILDSLVYTAKAAKRPYKAPSGPDITDLAALYNSLDGAIEVIGLADLTRFDRGGVTEGPADDPVADVSSIQFSLDMPPALADSPLTISPETTAPVADFAGSLPLDSFDGEPRLLFAQAFSADGPAGPPEATWLAERLALVSPASLGLAGAPDQTLSTTLTVTNIGSQPLDWSVDAEPGGPALAGLEPVTAEQIVIDDFDLPGGGTHSASAEAGLANRGPVIGFDFEGTVAGISDTQTWASDMALTIISPDGNSFSVGGYNAGNPPWDFDGSQSNDDGTYISSHIGETIFGEAGTEDVGTWQVDFEHTWNDAMAWSEVTITLRKIEPPECVDPEGLAWIELSQTGGTLTTESEQVIEISADTAGFEPGIYEARICVTTSDPNRSLVVVPLTLEITGDLLQDRFETVD